jgi:6-phosphofructokinase 1
MVEQHALMVATLGECRVTSHLVSIKHPAGEIGHLVSEQQRIRVNIEVGPENARGDDLSFEEAGPREEIFFEPAETAAAVVTCGGLSPGLNNVIRSAFSELSENYGAKRVLGIQNGYLGLNPQAGLEPM